MIVSDIDGVLAFLAEAIATALNARYGSGLLVENMTTYRLEDTLPAEQSAWIVQQFRRPAFYANLAPDFHALDAYAAMRAAGLQVIVTSDRPVEVRDATLHWLDYWRVPYDQVLLDGPGSKHRALAACGPGHPGVLVDDNPAKWLTVARPGVEVWTPQRPWTPEHWQRYPDVWVFQGWGQVLARLGVGAEAAA